MGVDAHAAVQGPAVGLIVVGSLTMVMQIASLAIQVLGTGLSFLNSGRGGPDAAGALLGGAFGIVFAILGLLVSGLVLYGAIKMKSLESYPLAMAASIIPMIPCTSGVCCLLGLPLGIWSLTVLMKPEVKAAFR
jgi:hypothetical protein